MIKRSICLLLCMVLLLTTCVGCGSDSVATKPEQTAQTQQTEVAIPSETDSAWAQWVNGIFIDWVTENTLDLHYTIENPASYGITDYPVTLGSCGQQFVEEQGAEAKKLLEELKEFDFDSLSESEQLTYEILKDKLELTVEGLQYPYYEDPLSPIIGMQAELPILLAEYKLNNAQDVEDYLGLLADVERYYGDLLTYEKEKSAAGLFMSDTVLDMVLKDIDAYLTDSQDSFMIETFAERLEGVSELSQAQKAAYIEKNKELVTVNLAKAYKTLKEGLEALRGTGTNEKGLCEYEKGDAYYQYLVHCEVGTDKSIDELMDLTETQMDDDFEKEAELLDRYPKLFDAFDDFSFGLTDPDEILTDLQEKIKKQFPALEGKVNYQVKQVSESLQDSTSPAFYLNSALDNSEENIIYVNYGLSDPATLYTTLAHEGFPGHLYETVYGASKTAPIRRLLETTGYSEGWATYVEYLSYYFDTKNKKNVLKLMQYNDSGSLAVYAMADYYVHHKHYSKEKLANYLEDYFGDLGQEVYDDFYYTIVSQPGNYLNYYVGYLEILGLKEYAKEELGKKFKIKDFHQFLMDMGNTPFYIIEEHLEQAIESGTPLTNGLGYTVSE